VSATSLTRRRSATKEAELSKAPSPRHEEWRRIAEFPAYEVSNLGRVRIVRILNTHISTQGYEQVGLYDASGKQKQTRIHRLVCQAFCGSGAEGLHAGHLDGDRLNNVADNLKWVTPAENEAHKILHGTRYRSVAPNARLTPAQAAEIRADEASSTADLCRKFGVTSRAVRDIRAGRTWKYLEAAR
jgi:hypothetical protein